MSGESLAGPMVRVRGLSKSYVGEPVLRGLDLDVARGEKLAIIGPSGSGKSTLLRLLMTLERPDAGRIEIGGQSVWTELRGGREVPAGEDHVRAVRGRVGMVFQQFNLFPHMRVLRNVALAPELVGGCGREEAEGRASELLRSVGLADKAQAWPEQLSGGQKQRVAIARALAMDPQVMLFDEVTSALDPQLVAEVLGVLRELAERTEIAMLVVTHEMQFARDIADRVLLFDAGRVVEEGAPEQMFTRPRHERTRAFLAGMLGTND